MSPMHVILKAGKLREIMYAKHIGLLNYTKSLTISLLAQANKMLNRPHSSLFCCDTILIQDQYIFSSSVSLFASKTKTSI